MYKTTLHIAVNVNNLPLSNAILIASTSSWKPATRYNPSDSIPRKDK